MNQRRTCQRRGGLLPAALIAAAAATLLHTSCCIGGGRQTVVAPEITDYLISASTDSRSFIELDFQTAFVLPFPMTGEIQAELFDPASGLRIDGAFGFEPEDWNIFYPDMAGFRTRLEEAGGDPAAERMLALTVLPSTFGVPCDPYIIEEEHSFALTFGGF